MKQFLVLTAMLLSATQAFAERPFATAADQAIEVTNYGENNRGKVAQPHLYVGAVPSIVAGEVVYALASVGDSFQSAAEETWYNMNDKNKCITESSDPFGTVACVGKGAKDQAIIFIRLGSSVPQAFSKALFDGASKALLEKADLFKACAGFFKVQMGEVASWPCKGMEILSKSLKYGVEQAWIIAEDEVNTVQYGATQIVGDSADIAINAVEGDINEAVKSAFKAAWNAFCLGGDLVGNVFFAPVARWTDSEYHTCAEGVADHTYNDKQTNKHLGRPEGR